MSDDSSGQFLIEEGGSWQPRVMVMFCDLVGSTELSGRNELERYVLMVRRYIAEARTAIGDDFGGDVVNVEGDGLLALFGAPHARGDDAERAIRAALGLIERVQALSVQTMRDSGEAMAVRIAVHRGQVYRVAHDSVYGLAVNVAARLQNFAAPNEVVISDEVQRMVGDVFETEAGEPQFVKGLDHPVRVHRVVGERIDHPVRRARSPLVGRTEEWDRLRSAWKAVRSGEREAAVPLLLRGEAGVGKSCLASQLAGLAADDEAVIVELVGSAFYEDSGTPSGSAAAGEDGRGPSARPEGPSACGFSAPILPTEACPPRPWCRCWPPSSASSLRPVTSPNPPMPAGSTRTSSMPHVTTWGVASVRSPPYSSPKTCTGLTVRRSTW